MANNTRPNYRLVKLLDKLRLDHMVLAYLDDILVHTKAEAKHLQSLNKVLEAHFKAGIKLKTKKTFLFEQDVDFLGHCVSVEMVSLSEGHMKTIKAIQEPTSGNKVPYSRGLHAIF